MDTVEVVISTTRLPCTFQPNNIDCPNHSILNSEGSWEKVPIISTIYRFNSLLGMTIFSGLSPFSTASRMFFSMLFLLFLLISQMQQSFCGGLFTSLRNWRSTPTTTIYGVMKLFCCWCFQWINMYHSQSQLCVFKRLWSFLFKFWWFHYLVSSWKFTSVLKHCDVLLSLL